MTSRLLFLLALPALALGACQDKPQDEDDARTASGEVLEGTIGDSMLPLDTVTSHPPLLKTQPAAAPTEAGDEAGEEGAEGETPGDAPPTATPPSPAAGGAAPSGAD